MEAAGTSNGASKRAAAKLIPKKLAVKGRWKKQPSNESFGSLVSAENEEHPRGRSPNSTRESERGGSGSSSLLTTTQSNEWTGDRAGDRDGDRDSDDVEDVAAGSIDFDVKRSLEHES
ncbi:hypothetical protein EKO27_g1479 [Xylaria grammica]|uniref:Uncharacterized protein n=1 Tax=Xylaria grammica TaxID=363999 RepID=A0A439DGQ1_9PEZI|nr:hypothetical protein EKO27_g1479 [Xylaria grammica]